MNMNEDKRIIIDYLSATFPLKPGDKQTEQDRVYELMALFRDYFRLSPAEVVECDYSVNRFKYQFILSDYIYLRCMGPENEDGYYTCQIELKGEGCRELERLRDDSTWYDFIYLLICMDAKFKRCDITIDDLSGMEMPIELLNKKVLNGLYSSVFRTVPKFHGTIETGLTIDFGSKTSMVELCIYDKKLQQASLGKSVDEAYWTRYEMRFRQEKAHSIVSELMLNYKDSSDDVYGLALGEFARKNLYAILDVKIDNNWAKSHQGHVATAPEWLLFLENTEKGELPKADYREPSTDGSIRYIVPKFKMVWLYWYVKCNKNLDLLNIRLMQEMKKQLINITPSQLKRFNQYLLEDGMDTLSMDEFRLLVTSIRERR